jgi:uncharacterized coiled-coil protein SlyX
MKPAKNEARMSVEARIAVVENTIQNINSTLLDFRQEMRRGFDKIDVLDSKLEAKLDALDNKLETKLDALDNKFETKLDALDNKFETKLDALDNKFETKFGAQDKKFESLCNKIDAMGDKIEARMWSNFLWLMGMIIGLAGLIAHTQHWI